MAKRGRIRVYFEGEERGVDEAARKSERAIDRVDAATKKYNATASQQAAATDRVKKRNFGMSTSTRRAAQDTHFLDRRLTGLNARFAATRNLMSLLKWPGFIAGAGAAAGGLGAMTAGAVGLTSALGPLSGVLVTYPALLTSFAQGLGVGQLALLGVSDALGELSDQHASAGATAQQNAKAQEAAAEQVKSAERAVTDAKRNAEDAEDDLREAREEAADQLTELKNAAASAALGEERATLSLQEAKQELRKALQDPASSGADIRDLELQVKEAKLALKEAREESEEAAAASAKANRQKVAGNPAVVDARQRLADANREVKESEDELADAQDEAREAMEGTGAAAGSLTQKLDSLPASAQRFTRFLFGLKPQVDELRESAADGLLPGVEDGIKSSLPLFPRLRAAVSSTADVLGNAARRAGDFIGDKAFGRDFSRITAGNAQLLGRFAGAGLHLSSALRHVLVAAQPFLGWLGKVTGRLSAYIDNAAEAGRESGRLGDFFGRTRRTMEGVGGLLQSVAAGFLSIGEAAAPLGTEILDALDRSAQRFEDWSESLEGRNSLRKYFDGAKPGIFETGRLVGALGKSLIRLSADRGFVGIARALREDLVPALEKTIRHTSRAFGPALVGLLVEVTKLFGNLAGNSGPLTAMVNVFRRTVGFVNLLIEKVPGLGEGAVALAGFVAANKALKFTATITGVSKLVEWFKKLRTVALGATAAEQAAAAPSGGGFLGKLGGKAKGAGLLGKLGGALGIGAAATTVAPAGMLSGAEVGALGGSGGLLAAAPAAGPWLAVGAAIAAAGAGLYLLYKHSETFRKLVDPLGDAAGDAFEEIKKQVSLLGDAFTGEGSPVEAAKDFYQQFKGPIGAVGDFLRSVLLRGVQTVFGTIADVIRGLGKVFAGQIQVIRGVVEVISGILTLRFDKAWDGVKNIFGGGVKIVLGVFKTLTAPIANTAKGIASVLKDVFGGAWEKVQDVFRNGRDAVIGLVEDIADVINLIPGIPDIEIGGDKSFAERAGNINSEPGASSGGLGKPKASQRYTGGPVNTPMVIVGEEAPAHPEWVIATNPRYRNQNLAYWMQAGRDLGVPGFLTGGDIWGAAKGAASSVGGAALGLAGKGAGFFIDRLPTPDLPVWMGNLGGYVIDKVSDWIRSGFSSGDMGAKPAKIPAAAKAWNGKTLIGRVSWFNGPASTTASGTPVAKPGLALNLNPGTDSGWDNETTRAWMAAAAAGRPVYGRTTIAGHTANLPIIDLGPSGFTGRAIDVTEGGVRKLGLDPATFPTDSIGKVRILARRRGGLIGPVRDWSGSTSTATPYSRGYPKGSAGRAADWARNNLGVGEGSAKHRKWVGETEGVFDPWCAEFVGAMLISQGVPIPANSAYTPEYERGWEGGKKIGSSISLARPGDLLGYSGEHIGVYVGGGQFISGNWSNEVGIAPWDAPSYPLTAVMRPFYPGGAGKKGSGASRGPRGRGGGTRKPPKPKMGLGKGEAVAVPPLGPTPLPPGGDALPPRIKEMLQTPGLTGKQQLSIVELAGSLASSTKEPIYDAQGFEVSADSHADDIAAAEVQKAFALEQKKRIEAQLKKKKKELEQVSSPEKRRRLLAKQGRLLGQLGSVRSTLQGLNETINTGPDDPLNAPPSAMDYLNRDLALAELTPDGADDQAVRDQMLKVAEDQLEVARQTADPRDDIEAAQNVKALREAVSSLTEVMQQREALDRERLEVDKRLAALAETQGPALLAGLLAYFDGAIGGPIQTRQRLAPAGVGAAYNQ